MATNWSRREFLRLAAAGAVAIGAGGALSACGPSASRSALDKAKRAGVINVGIAGELPYGYLDNGRPTGESPEIARAVFKRLGVRDITATQVEFNSLIPGLIGRQFDVIAAGMNITPARCQQVTFSVPDYVAPTALLVPRGNPFGLSSLTDVAKKGKRVAVFREAVEQAMAKEAGITDDHIYAYSSQDAQDALLKAVVDGQADCAALSNISLNSLVRRHPEAAVEVTKGFYAMKNGQPVISAGGFVFRREDQELVDAFNRELTTLHGSGEWRSIVLPFGFDQDNIPPTDLTTAKLCGF